MSTTVLLLRHGQSTWNAARRWQGQADPPLSELGEEQARQAATRLGQFDAIVASDLQRAQRTAELIAGELGVGPVLLDPRLRENDAGEWTGRTHDEIHAEWPGWVEAGRRPPGFEDHDTIVTRGLTALLALGRQFPGATVLGVTHGGLMRAVRRALGGAETGFPNLSGQWFTVHERDVVLDGGVVHVVDGIDPESTSIGDRERL